MYIHTVAQLTDDTRGPYMEPSEFFKFFKTFKIQDLLFETAENHSVGVFCPT